MPKPLYDVQYDENDRIKISAWSLAELTNSIRGKAQRIRVWAPSGMQLIDTKFGDVYNLIPKEIEDGE